MSLLNSVGGVGSVDARVRVRGWRESNFGRGLLVAWVLKVLMRVKKMVGFKFWGG